MLPGRWLREEHHLERRCLPPPLGPKVWIMKKLIILALLIAVGLVAAKRLRDASA